MRREGAWAEAVKSVFPSVTYPAHTTIITGRMPIDHGIYYNSPFEASGQSGRWYWEEDDIRVSTLWDAARAAGLKTASIFWPVTVGAPIDWNVPEIWPLDWQTTEFTAPMRRAATPPGLVEELERQATGRLSSVNFSFGRLNLDDKSSEMAAYLLATYRPNLLAIHLLALDGVQHEHGLEAAGLPRALAAMDRCVARLVEAAEQVGILDRTTFLITGDHGFIETHTRLSPNVWFVEAGLMAPQPDRGDWRATVHNTSVAGFVFLADEEDREALARARSILDSQPEEVRALYTILEREDMKALQGSPDAALGITPAPGAYISSGHEPPAVQPSSGANHGYLPEHPEMFTGFVAWGAGIRAGGRVSLMGLEHLAPLVSILLGLELEGVDASAPSDLLAADYSGTTPP